jgi:hypothetical protein
MAARRALDGRAVASSRNTDAPIHIFVIEAIRDRTASGDEQQSMSDDTVVAKTGVLIHNLYRISCSYTFKYSFIPHICI